MRHPLLVLTRHALALALITILIAGGSGAAGAIVQAATPATTSGHGRTTMVLVEHNDHETTLDFGEPGPSAGDMLVWGPNPLYDEANAGDTGATSQGTCVALHVADHCLLNETVVFADGSTIQLQGIERGGGTPSTRTIVGGSGRYLGATGTLSVSPTEDELLWTKTFEIIEP